MSKRIIITGATGLIGSAISRKLIKRRDEVVVFSRSPEKAKQKVMNAFSYIKWNYDSYGDWKSSINEADAIIHLAGENVMGARWNEEHKNKVLNSRVNGTRNLVKAIGELAKKPEVFICASAIGYYNSSIEAVVDEDSQAGTSFLSMVTKRWEEEAAEVEKFGVRRVNIRIGIVLDKNDGALAKMITPFKYFIGGPLGTGNQWMPWIHVDDIADLFIYALDNKVSGVLNGVAPSPVKMKEFAKTLGKVLKRPSFFYVPEFVLRIVLGEAANVVLSGSKVIPKRTMEAGYKFAHTNLEETLQNIFKK